MAIVTAPENFKKLDRYKEISRRLALAEGLTDDQARALAEEGKAVVWIDGGLHATEVLGAQQLIETVYQLVSRDRRGDDAHPARRDHPRRRTPIPTAWSWSPTGTCANPIRSSARIGGAAAALPEVHRPRQQPRLLHDRTSRRSMNMNRILYREWFPQIVYNHHQTGPAGTVMFAPPFRDPFNYVFDPLDRRHGIDLVGAAMHTRFAAEGKPGVTMRSGVELLDVVERRPAHDGLLPQPDRPADRDRSATRRRCRLPFVPDAPAAERRPAVPDRAAGVALPPVDRLLDHRQLRGARLRVSATARRLLYNIYAMGKNAIERGNTRQLDDLSAPHRGGEGRDRQGRAGATARRLAHGERRPRRHGAGRVLRDAARSPSGAIRAATSCPPNKRDFLTATKFVNITDQDRRDRASRDGAVHASAARVSGRLATS